MTVELQEIINSLELALENARRAKRIHAELRDGDPTTRLRQARTSALSACRLMSELIPGEMSSV